MGHDADSPRGAGTDTRVGRGMNPGAPGATRSLGAIASVLLGLTGLAVAQPLYDLVSQNPEFFVAHRAARADILLLTAVLSLAVPLACATLAWLVGRISEHLQSWFLGLLIAALVALFAVQVLKGVGVAASISPWVLVVLSLLFGGVVAAAHARLALLQSFAMFLAAGAVLFPAMFLAKPAIWKLVFPGRVETTTTGLEHAETPVVLVIFDQLPITSLMDGVGRIDSVLYPNFAALAEDGTWYRNATAVANESAWAIPAILTGQYPDPDKGLPSWLDYPDSLFSLLHPRYSMRVEEPVTQLCPTEICGATAQRLSVRLFSQLADLAIVYAHVVVPPQWSSRLPALTDNWMNFGVSPDRQRRREYLEWTDSQTRWDWTEKWVARRDADRRAGFNELVAAIGTERQPALYLAHLLLPHEPYEFLPSGRWYFLATGSDGLLPNGRWANEPATIREIYQRHLLQLAHVDRLLGTLVSKLKHEGLYDRALVVVTADHGASYVPGDEFKELTATNYADILSVPLIVKTPGQDRVGIDDRNAETIDILPTIAEFLDVDVGWTLDGKSLLADPDPKRQKKAIWYGAASGRRLHSVDDVIARRNEAVSRKLSLFGAAGDPLRRARSVLDEQLVGRRVGDFQRADDGSLVVVLDYPTLFSHVDLESEFIPARVSGRLRRSVKLAESDGNGVIELAIALNGIVWATTRSLPDKDSDETSSWAVIVPERGFVEGANQIEVFAVESTPDGPLLRLAPESGSRTVIQDNLVMPVARWTHGVEISGFLGLEWSPDGLPWRWTTPHAVLRVPIDPENPPTGVDILVRHVNRQGHRLRIMVNGCTVLRRRVRNAFREKIAVGDCAVEGSELLLEFISDRFEPEPRPRGVAVSSIILLDESAWQQ